MKRYFYSVDVVNCETFLETYLLECVNCEFVYEFREVCAVVGGYKYYAFNAITAYERYNSKLITLYRAQAV